MVIFRLHRSRFGARPTLSDSMFSIAKRALGGRRPRRPTRVHLGLGDIPLLNAFEHGSL